APPLFLSGCRGRAWRLRGGAGDAPEHAAEPSHPDAGPVGDGLASGPRQSGRDAGPGRRTALARPLAAPAAPRGAPGPGARRAPLALAATVPLRDPLRRGPRAADRRRQRALPAAARGARRAGGAVPARGGPNPTERYRRRRGPPGLPLAGSPA